MLHYLHLVVFALLMLLQVADFWSSKYIFEKGYGHEANKWIAVLITKIGIVPGLMIAKCLALVAIVFIWYSSDHHSPLYVFVMIALLLVYIKVVWNNLGIIDRVKGWFNFT